jgi:hypothetical protein
MEMRADHERLSGISAVLMLSPDLDSVALDLIAVLEGLVSRNFELVVVLPSMQVSGPINELRARAPGVPLRVVEGEDIRDACNTAVYDLIYVSAADGQFDVRELNHLLDEVEKGADVAVGYRPKRTDAIFRSLERLGWHRTVDCAFGLIRSGVWHDVAALVCAHDRTPWVDLVAKVRRLGYVVSEVPVSGRRPTFGATELYAA